MILKDIRLINTYYMKQILTTNLKINNFILFKQQKNNFLELISMGNNSSRQEGKTHAQILSGGVAIGGLLLLFVPGV